MAIAVSASALVHATALVAVLVLVRPIVEHRPVIVLPISLVSRPGGGAGGEAGPAQPGPTPAEVPRPEETPSAVESPPPPSAPIVRRKTIAKAKPAPVPAPPSAVVGSGDAGGDDTATAARGGGGGGGAGSGPGSGSSGASPAYGVNPQPPYPMAARRLGLEGTVVLRVVVAPDGAPASVVVLQSSGHDVLDSSALETVRTRWRFVPARRNGIPVEDSVQVPIRFRQTAG